MPLTLERLVQVINAGMDHKHALGVLCTHIQLTAQSVTDGTMDAQSALKSIQSIASPKNLLLTTDSEVTLEHENQWFSKNLPRIHHDKMRKRHDRGGLVGKPRPDAPPLLLPTVPVPSIPPQLPLEIQEMLGAYTMRQVQQDQKIAQLEAIVRAQQAGLPPEPQQPEQPEQPQQFPEPTQQHETDQQKLERETAEEIAKEQAAFDAAFGPSEDS